MSVTIPPKSILRIVIDPNSKKVDNKAIQQKKPAEEPDIQYPVVVKTTKQTLIIDEFDSHNGKALIQCCAKSKKTGVYTYIYYDREHRKVEFNINTLSLFSEENEEIKIDKFLTC
jgi:hypothetical protein